MNMKMIELFRTNCLKSQKIIENRNHRKVTEITKIKKAGQVTSGRAEYASNLVFDTL